MVSLLYRDRFGGLRLWNGRLLLTLGLLDLLVDAVPLASELILQVFEQMLVSLGVLPHDIVGQVLPVAALLDQVRHQFLRQVGIRIDIGAVELLLQQVLEEGLPDVGLVGLEESVVQPIGDWRVFLH